VNQKLDDLMNGLIEIGKERGKYHDLMSHNYISRCKPIVLAISKQIDCTFIEEEQTKKCIREIAGDDK